MCIECAERYYEEAGYCLKCSLGCLTCSSDDDCLQCEYGFVLSNGGACLECEESCLEC